MEWAENVRMTRRRVDGCLIMVQFVEEVFPSSIVYEDMSRNCIKVNVNHENISSSVIIYNELLIILMPNSLYCFIGVRPFVCNLCDKSYGRKDYLDRHMKSHTSTNSGMRELYLIILCLLL